MSQAAPESPSEQTQEFYRLQFFKERAEDAVEMAKHLHANSLDGNQLIPAEAFGRETSKDHLGNDGNIGFAGNVSKLHNGYKVEILKDSVPFEEHHAVNPLHIIEKKEADKWDIKITAPANLSRENIAYAFGQTLGKELTKEDFRRTEGGVEDGVPLANVTINLAALLKAPDMHIGAPGGQLQMVKIGDPSKQLQGANAEPGGPQEGKGTGQYL